MKPWDTVRREVAGAWRSVRYDLDHRSKAGDARAGASEAGVESKDTVVLSRVTGFETTTPSGPERKSIWTPLRDPRRLLATVGVASAITASATGTFFAVTGGLGILLVDSHGAPSAPQSVPASAPQVVTSATPRQRQAPAPNRPSPSASARVSPSAARPTVAPKPSPSTAAAVPSPSHSPAPDNSPTTTVSSTTSPDVTPSAETAP